MKVVFIGAGPGDPELITVKGAKVLRRAEVIIYAGSLVNPDILSETRDNARIFDSAKMNLDDLKEVYLRYREKSGTVARLHTGDPSLYSAIQEQIDFCRDNGISYEIIPGVSSFAAGAASMERELTLPGVSQTVILTRISGRTKTPQQEDLVRLARHQASMVIFLSASRIREVVEKLRSYYPEQTPVSLVYRASWPDQQVHESTLAHIAEVAEEAHITRHALIYVGRALAGNYELSKLYDREFSHGYRKGDEG